MIAAKKIESVADQSASRKAAIIEMKKPEHSNTLYCPSDEDIRKSPRKSFSLHAKTMLSIPTCLFLGIVTMVTPPLSVERGHSLDLTRVPDLKPKQLLNLTKALYIFLLNVG